MKKCCTCTNNGVSSGWPRAALISFRFDLKLPRGEEGRRGEEEVFQLLLFEREICERMVHSSNLLFDAQNTIERERERDFCRNQSMRSPLFSSSNSLLEREKTRPSSFEIGKFFPRQQVQLGLCIYYFKLNFVCVEWRRRRRRRRTEY